MFERFTEAARAVVMTAHEEAHLMRHDHVGTEHLLVGLAGDPTMAPLLAPYELSRERARRRSCAWSGWASIPRAASCR